MHEAPIHWMIPYVRNPFFTGREDIFAQLYEAFQGGINTILIQPQGLTGLGGIGKTQTAVEYAYRYQQDYQAVLWINGDTQETLIAGLVAIATTLALPEYQERDQNRVIEAVQRWLRLNDRWLLIIDNVESMALINALLPTAYRGHILITTRAHALGNLGHSVTIEKMLPEVGALLLLRRAGMIEVQAQLYTISEEMQQLANTIAQALDGLPLAIDQAGAYIRETGCSLSDYLALYYTRRTQLLTRRGENTVDHPDAVATTWSLSFEQVQQENPAATELLCFCSFLYPDAIPEEIFTDHASLLDPPLNVIATNAFGMNTAIRSLLRFSLLQRSARMRTISMHRLVQAVLKDRMHSQMQRKWSERAIQVINQAFPHVDFAVWSRCERYLPHAQVCANLVNEWQFSFPEAARLLHKTGFYLEERAQYGSAEQLLQQAKDLYEGLYGSEHPDVADCLNSIAELYRAQSRYNEAEPLYLQALRTREKTLPANHVEIAQSLNNLAVLYCNQGHYSEAEPLYQKVLNIRIQALGEEHHEVAFALSNLAALYYQQGRYAEAGPLYTQSLYIAERNLGPEHLDLAINLNNLALLYRVQHRNQEAELLLQRVLYIREKALGLEHPDVATTLTNLAGLTWVLGKHAQAEELYQRAIRIYAQFFGIEHPNMVFALNGLAAHYVLQKQYERAQPLYLQAIDICQKIGRSKHTDMAMNLSGLATLYYHQGKYGEAEPLYQEALKLYEQLLGPLHSSVAACVSNLGMLYNKLSNDELAETFLQRTLTIYLQILGADHPDTIKSMLNLAVSYYNQGKYTSAEQLYQEVLVKQQIALGPHHPEVAQTTTRLAKLYMAMGRFKLADNFYQLTVTLYEQAYGSIHASLAQALDQYAAFLQQRHRNAKAAKLHARAQSIYISLAQQSQEQAEVS